MNQNYNRKPGEGRLPGKRRLARGDNIKINLKKLMGC
jgi:hypothetical protein